MPAMSSASVAVTAPSVSRTRAVRAARALAEDRGRDVIAGITMSVASASRQSRKKRITAVPTSVSVFWTSDVTPSVTSWSSASTSFVSRLMSTPARLRS